MSLRPKALKVGSDGYIHKISRRPRHISAGIQPQTDKNENRETGKNTAKVGLQINNDKPRQCKTIEKQQSQSDQNSHIYGGGGKVTKHGNTEAEIKTRIRKTKGAICSTKDHRSGRRKRSARKQTYTIFKSKSTSILQCAAESWQVTKRNVLYAIEVFLNKCTVRRRILHIFWPNKLPNAELHERTGMLHPMDS